MKLPEIIQNIRTYLYNGRVPNSNRLDDRQIIYWINTQRALWLRREYNQMREVKDNERQILYGVNLEVIGDVTSPIILQSGYSILRSTYKIPATIHSHINDGILAVRGMNKLAPRINYCSREEVIYKGNGWFNKNKIWAFKDDDYIWIKYADKNDKAQILKEIQVEGVFENPIQVDIFNITPNDIRLGNAEYPVSASFINFIESKILELNIQRFVADGSANDEEDTVRLN